MIKAFLRKELKLYEDVEVIVHCITVAVVKISVESVVESLVSRYSNHISPMRQGTSEISSLEEMIISENGPLLQHADSIIESAMNRYWTEKKMSGWHFLRKSRNIESYRGGSSKVIGRLLNTPSKFPFMT